MEEKKSYIEQLLGDLKNLNSEDAGMELIAALLNLDDDLNTNLLHNKHCIPSNQIVCISFLYLSLAILLD